MCGVVLLCAEVDHIAGLLNLRELQPFTVYATASVTSVLREQNTMFRMLNRVPEQVHWQVLHPDVEITLRSLTGEDAGLCCHPIPISDHYPSYVCAPEKLAPADATLGLILTSKNGGSIGYFPTVGAITEQLRVHLDKVDLLLFDGTFWSEDELIQVQGSGQRARDMGHTPVGGDNGSLRRLAGIRAGRKLYIHINNTNPMLNEAAQNTGPCTTRDGN